MAIPHVRGLLQSHQVTQWRIWHCLTMVLRWHSYSRLQGRILGVDMKGGDDESQSSSQDYGSVRSTDRATPWMTLYQGRTLRAVLGGFRPGHTYVALPITCTRCRSWCCNTCQRHALGSQVRFSSVWSARGRRRDWRLEHSQLHHHPSSQATTTHRVACHGYEPTAVMAASQAPVATAGIG